MRNSPRKMNLTSWCWQYAVDSKTARGGADHDANGIFTVLGIAIFVAALVFGQSSELHAAMRRIDMATLPGCYGERYEVKDEDGSPKSYTGYTFLEIQRSSESGQLRFSAGATGGFGGNLHYCSAVGDLEVNELDSDLVVFSLNPDREEAEMEEALGLKCRMKIIVTPRSFYLHDFGYQC